jgi:site-specific recombinase XerD
VTLPADYPILRDQFRDRLNGAGKSPRTIETYVESVDQFGNHLSGIKEEVELTADITPQHIDGWMIALRDAGRKSSTRNNRFRGLQAFFKFLIAEEEITVSPMAALEVPSPGVPNVDVIPEGHITKLLATCGKGRDRDFRDFRDEAVIRLFASTGVRRDEMVTPTLSDLSVPDRTLYVLGKGDGDGKRPRLLAFGPKTALALERYLRVRSRHPKAKGTDALWIGRLGPLTESGIKDLIDKRCELAGVPHIHPHQFRHTYSDEYLRKGGEEGDLMQLNGWKTRAMVDRYAAKQKADRAREAYRRIQPGEDY